MAPTVQSAMWGTVGAEHIVGTQKSLLRSDECQNDGGTLTTEGPEEVQVGGQKRHDDQGQDGSTERRGPMGWHRARAISRLQARWRGKHQGLFRQREELRVTLVLAPWDPEPTLPLFLGRLWAWPGGFWETSPP